MSESGNTNITESRQRRRSIYTERITLEPIREVISNVSNFSGHQEANRMDAGEAGGRRVAIESELSDEGEYSEHVDSCDSDEEDQEVEEVNRQEDWVNKSENQKNIINCLKEEPVKQPSKPKITALKKSQRQEDIVCGQEEIIYGGSIVMLSGTIDYADSIQSLATTAEESEVGDEEFYSTNSSFRSSMSGKNVNLKSEYTTITVKKNKGNTSDTKQASESKRNPTEILNEIRRHFSDSRNLCMAMAGVLLMIVVLSLVTSGVVYSGIKQNSEQRRLIRDPKLRYVKEHNMVPSVQASEFEATLNVPVVPPIPTLICGIRDTLKAVDISHYCTHVVFTGIIRILYTPVHDNMRAQMTNNESMSSNSNSLSLKPVDMDSFEAFKDYTDLSTKKLVAISGISISMDVVAHLKFSATDHFIEAAGKFLTENKLDGVEIFAEPNDHIDSYLMIVLSKTCKKLKELNQKFLVHLRIRHNNRIRDKNYLECFDIVIFRTEYHELVDQRLRPPNPIKKYKHHSIQDIFLKDELEKIAATVPQTNQDQEWCFSLSLGGLLFKPESQQPPKLGDKSTDQVDYVSLSQICRWFDRTHRYSGDVETSFKWSYNPKKRLWISYDDWESIANKIVQATQDNKKFCVAVYLSELDDHKLSCQKGPVPVIKAIMDKLFTINNITLPITLAL